MFIYVLGFLEHNSRILLMLRQNTSFHSGFYGMMGGKVEANESITQALIREADEELGIVIRQKDIHFAHCLSWKTERNEDLVVLVFKINSWQGNLTNKEPHKCKELAWFSYDKLPYNIIPRHKLIIDKIKESISYSEFGWE